MINTIILDIGQVLAEFRWNDYMIEKGYSDETIKKISSATVLSKYWGEQDRGLLSEEELVTLCCELDPSVSKEIRELFRDIIKLVKEYDYSEKFVKDLKNKGYKVYLLSNFGRIFEVMKHDFKFYPHVDGGVISYEVNQIKPEPEIYQTLIDKYNINPNEAVFLDDLQVNLEAAKSFGINTIQVIEFHKTLEELRKLGVVVGE